MLAPAARTRIAASIRLIGPRGEEQVTGTALGARPLLDRCSRRLRCTREASNDSCDVSGSVTRPRSRSPTGSARCGLPSLRTGSTLRFGEAPRNADLVIAAWHRLRLGSGAGDGRRPRRSAAGSAATARRARGAAAPSGSARRRRRGSSGRAQGDEVARRPARGAVSRSRGDAARGDARASRHHDAGCRRAASGRDRPCAAPVGSRTQSGSLRAPARRRSVRHRRHPCPRSPGCAWA